MDLEVEIKEEPVRLEGIAITSPENFELVSEMKEIKSELAEPGPTQENTLEPSVDIKQEIFVEQDTVEELVPYIKEENKFSMRTGERGSTYAERRRLQSHVVTRYKKETFACVTCSKTFQTKNNLLRHMATHTVGRPRPYRCEECRIAFYHRWHLKSHMATHSEEKPYLCDICRCMFWHKRALIQHVVICSEKRFSVHAGERVHFCEECGSSFARRHQLQKHMVTHCKERPYSCEVCSKTYPKKYLLNRHTRTHSTDRPRPHHCQECNRTYLKRSHLRNHMVTHSGIRPYHCQECSSTFSLPAYLRLHMLNVHAHERS